MTIQTGKISKQNDWSQ